MSGFSIDHIKKAVESISKSGFGDFMNQNPSSNDNDTTKKQPTTSQNRPRRSGKSEPWSPVSPLANSEQDTSSEQQTTKTEQASEQEQQTERKPMDWNKLLF